MNTASIIAHIKSLTVEIQHSNFEDIPKLKSKVLSLYEQLVVLEHTHELDEAISNTPIVQQSDLTENLSKEAEIFDEADLKAGLEEFPLISNIEKAVEVPEVVSTEIKPEQPFSGPELLHELESITEGFELPEFEPASPTLNSIQETPKSLNEVLNNSVQIGLNDRIAFINHLFDRNQEDYTRVISQVNTMQNADEVLSFINSFVKPEYEHWEGKEAMEERFVQVVLNRFKA